MESVTDKVYSATLMEGSTRVHGRKVRWKVLDVSSTLQGS